MDLSHLPLTFICVCLRWQRTRLSRVRHSRSWRGTIRLCEWLFSRRRFRSFQLRLESTVRRSYCQPGNYCPMIPPRQALTSAPRTTRNQAWHPPSTVYGCASSPSSTLRHGSWSIHGKPVSQNISERQSSSSTSTRCSMGKVAEWS